MVMMKVLFVYCSTPEEDFSPQYSNGIGSLSARLRMQGHATSCLLLTRFDRKKIDACIETFRPGAVAISFTTDQAGLARATTRHLFNFHRLPVFLGGVHTTVAPEEAVLFEGAAGICRGEGDLALAEVISKLEKNEDYTRTPNFWFHRDGRTIRNDPRPRITDLNALPFPERETQEGFIDFGASVEMMASRGCPFSCAYCNNFMSSLYPDAGRRVVFRSVDHVVREIEGLVRKYSPKLLVFHDDVFTLNKAWLREFSRAYPKVSDVPIQVNGHVKTINPETVEMLKAARVIEVKLGVESGNEALRRSVLGRDITNNEMLRAAELLHAKGLRVGTFNMIGLPGETPGNIEETIALNRAMMPLSTFGRSVFKPYPGTALYEACRAQGLLSARTTESFMNETSVLDQKSITAGELAYYYRVFKPEVLGMKSLPWIRFLARRPRLARLLESAKRLLKRFLPRAAVGLIKKSKKKQIT